MTRRERDILEHAVQAIAEQAANTSKVIDEAMEAGLAADHPVTVANETGQAGAPESEGRSGAGTRDLGARLKGVRHGRALGSGHQHV